MARGVRLVSPATYAKNVARSAKYIAVESIKGVNEDLTDFIGDTRDAAVELRDTMRNKDRPGLLERLFSKDTSSEIKGVAKNFFEDLKTGNFYNAEREMESTGSLLEDWGMSFDFNLDDDDSFGEDVESSSSEDSAKKSPATMADKIAMVGCYGSALSAEKISSVSTKNTKATIVSSERMFNKVNRTLGLINASIIDLHSSIAEPLSNHINNSTSFYTTATEQLAKQTAHIANIESILKDRFAPTSEKGWGGKNTSYYRTPWASVMDGGGIPKVGTWVKSSVGKLLDETGLNSFMEEDMLSTFLKGYGGSPVSFILTQLLTGALKKSSSGKALNRTSDILKSGFMKLATKVHRTANENTGILGTIASIFDIVPNLGKAKPDFSKYNKGRAEWTGKDSRALQEVIPTQLAAILSAITHQEAKIYDYDLGKFVSPKSTITNFNKKRLENISSSTYGFKDKMIDDIIENDKSYAAKSGNNFATYTRDSKAMRNLANDFDHLIMLLGNNGIDLSEIDSKDKFLKICSRWTDARIPIMRKRSVKLIADAIFNDNASFGNFTNSFIKGRISDNNFMSNAGESFGSFRTIKNGSGIYNAGKNKVPGGLVGLDDRGNDVFFYLQDYYRQLRVIANKISAPKEGPIKKFFGGSTKSKTVDFDPNSIEIPSATNRREHKSKSSPTLVQEIAGDNTLFDSGSDEADGRLVYDSKTGKYVNKDDIKEKASINIVDKVKATSKSTREKEKKSNPVTLLIDGMNNTLDKLFFGDGIGSIKNKFLEYGGLSGFLTHIPEMIADAGTKLWQKIAQFGKKSWEWFKETKFGSNFLGETKNITKGFFKNSYDYAKDRFFKIKDAFSNKEAKPEGSYRGGEVTKSGMVSVSEGELIIPADKNPNYHGNLTNFARKSIERKNYNNWKKSGGDDNDFFGFYADGGKVEIDDTPLTNNEKAKIVKYINKGHTSWWIRNHINKSGPIVDEFIKKTKREFKLRRNIEKANNKYSKVKEKITESEPYNDAVSAGKWVLEKSKDAVDRIFGKNIGDNAKQIGDEILVSAKVNLPKTIASGTLSAIIGGAMTGSPLGLLGGFALGAGHIILQNSSSLTEKLFGKYDKEKDEWSGGKLNKNLSNFIKKRAPNVLKAGGAGAILGTLGIAPGGLYGGMVLGAGLELVSGTKTFQDLMFGKEDINKQRHGGIIGSLKTNIVDPLTKFVHNGMDKVGDFFKKNVFEPLKKLFNPVKDWFKGIKKRIGKFIKERFLKKVGRTIAEHINAKFIRPISKVAGAVGKWIIKKPIEFFGKATNAAGERLQKHNIRLGYSSLSPEERMKYEGKNIRYAHNLFIPTKFHNSEYTKWAAQASDDDIMQASEYLNGIRSKKRNIKNARQNIRDIATASLVNGGNTDPKVVKEITRLFNTKDAINNSDFSEVSQYISGLNDNIIGSDTKKKLLDKIAEESKNISSMQQGLGSFSEDREAFYAKFGLGLKGVTNPAKRKAIEAKRLMFNRSASIQSMIDKENIEKKRKGLINDEMNEAINEDTKKKLLEQQKNESPIDGERNTLLHGIKDMATKIYEFISGKKAKTNIEDEKEASMAEENSSIPMPPVGGFDALNNNKHLFREGYKYTGVDSQGNPVEYVFKNGEFVPNNSDASTNTSTSSNAIPMPPIDGFGSHSTNSSSIPMPPVGGFDSLTNEQKEGHKITKINALGFPVEYVYHNGELVENNSDASTKQGLDEVRDNAKLQSTFYRSILDSGLLNINGLFKESGSGNGSSEEGETWWQKSLKYLGLIAAGIALVPVLFKKLPSFLKGLVDNFAESQAGGARDPGMNNEKDPEKRKKEVEKMGLFGKTKMSLDSAENIIRDRDTTTYDPDDYTSEYMTDRYNDRFIKNLLLGFNPRYVDKADKFVKAVNKGFHLPGAKMLSGSKVGNVLDKIPFVKRIYRSYTKARHIPGSRLITNTLNFGTFPGRLHDPRTKKKFIDWSIEKQLKFQNYKAAHPFKGAIAEKIGDGAKKVFGWIGDGIKSGSKAAKEAVSNTKLVTKLKKIFTDVINAVYRFIGKRSTKMTGLVLADQIDDIAEQFGKQIVKKAGVQAAKLLTDVIKILDIVFITAAVIKGFSKKKSKVILGILDEPTFIQRVISAVLNGLNEAIPVVGGLIPTEWFVNLVLGLLNLLGIGKTVFKKLNEQRAAAKAELEQYNTEHKTTYNLEEYIHNVQGERDYTEKENEKFNEKSEVDKFIDTAQHKNPGIINLIPKVNEEKLLLDTVLPSANGGFSNKIVSGMFGLGKAASMHPEGAKEGLTTMVNNRVDLFKWAYGFSDEKPEFLKPNDQVQNPDFDSSGSGSGLKDSRNDTMAKLTGTDMSGKFIAKNDSTKKKSFIAKFIDDISNSIKMVPIGIMDRLADSTSYLIGRNDEKGAIVKFINGINTAFSKISPANWTMMKESLEYLLGTSEKAGIFEAMFNRTFEKVAKKDKGFIQTIKDIFGGGSDKEEDVGSGSGVHTSQKGNYSSYGSSNIDEDGCGPAVASTVLKSYGHKSNINSAAKYAEAGGYVAGSSKAKGTKASYFGDILGKQGISTKYTKNKGSIESSIESGKPTILLGQDRNNTSKNNSPFGPNPHYVVAQGKDRDGNIIVDDPELGGPTKYNKNILRNTKLGIETGGASNIISAWTQGTLGAIGSKIGGPAGKIFDMIFGISRDSNSDSGNTNGSTSSDGASTGGTWGSTSSDGASTGGTNGSTSSDGASTGGTWGSPSGNSDYISSNKGRPGPIPGVPEPEMPGEGYEYLKYYQVGNGGLSPCVTGNGPVNAATALPNCVGWASGRFNEIYSRLTNTYGKYSFPFSGNAGQFISESKSSKMAMPLEVGQDPRPGAIAVWANSGSGHVGIVESVSEDQSETMISESHWGVNANKSNVFVYPLKLRAREDNCGTFLGYIYNPAVTDELLRSSGVEIPDNHVSPTFKGGPPDPHNPSGEARIAATWKCLKDLGYSDETAAGIMGNWSVESAIDADRIEADYVEPKLTNEQRSAILNDPKIMNDYTINRVFAYTSGINRQAYIDPATGLYICGIGLAQWTGDWGAKFLAYCKKRKVNPRSLRTQLEWFEYDTPMKKPKTDAYLRAADTPEKAAAIFYDGYERGYYLEKSDMVLERDSVHYQEYLNGKVHPRIARAIEIYNRYKGTAGSEEGEELQDNGYSPNDMTSGKGVPEAQLSPDQRSDISSRADEAMNLTSDKSVFYQGTNDFASQNLSNNPMLDSIKAPEMMASGSGLGTLSRRSTNSGLVSRNYSRNKIVDPIKSLSGSGSNIKSGNSFYSSRNSVPNQSNTFTTSGTTTYRSLYGGKSAVPSNNTTAIAGANAVVEYLKQIATNTGYNASIPVIIDLMKDSIEVMSGLNTGGSEGNDRIERAQIEDTSDSVENTLNVMRSRLESIAQTI